MSMKVLLVPCLFFAALGAAWAQDPAPAATPSPSPAAQDPNTEPTVPDPAALGPALREEVNLADTANSESMEIPPPPDATDPETAGEIAGKLPGDEEVPQRPPVTGTLEVTAQDNGKVVSAVLGNLIRITLESNPSTGYNWELRDFEYGAADFYASDVVARQSGNVFVGAPGNTILTLQAVKAGTQQITAVYRRPWEAPDQVAATFSFQLEVAGDKAAPSASPEASPAP
jgi:predicted secreted protein